MVCVIMYIAKMQVVCAKSIMLHSPNVQNSVKTWPRANKSTISYQSGQVGRRHDQQKVCHSLCRSESRCCPSSFGDAFGHAHRFLCMRRVRDLDDLAVFRAQNERADRGQPHQPALSTSAVQAAANAHRCGHALAFCALFAPRAAASCGAAAAGQETSRGPAQGGRRPPAALRGDRR